MKALFLFGVLSATMASAGPLAPRGGWVFVPGAQDLIQAGEWGCTSGVAVGTRSLAITASSSGYITPINTAGPRLMVQGDFSVMATISDPHSAGASLTLEGALSTGPNWWNGIQRLDAGVASNNVGVNYWTGASSSATAHTFALPAGASDPETLEVARIGGQIVVFVNSSQVGNFADPGLFASGQVYFGFNVPPGETLNVLALAAAMPAGSSTALSTSNPPVATRTGSALRDFAAPAGLLIGAAADSALLSDSNYAQTLGREFNLLVPENELKFGQTEPAAHRFSFCGGDQLLAFAQANGMQMRGHNLVWSQNLPGWLTNGNYSSADATAILQEHISTVVGHYRGKLVDWDVVNEAISDAAPNGFSASYWLTQLGSSYLDQAFQWAHAADPNAKLFYNDYNGEGLNAKSDAIYNLMEGMLSRGVPINGVGLEMHLTLNPPSAADISANMARLGALGLEVHVSEMDVRVPVDSNGNATAANLAAQATLYQNVLAACQASANCSEFLTWGISDAHSWIPSTFPGFGAGLLLDSQYRAKPAYSSASDALSSNSTTLPAIFPNGIVIHGGTTAVVSPGSLVDIYGANLAATPVTTPSFPLETTLGMVQVSVNGAPAPLYYVSSDQIVFQIPYSTAPGSALVQVTSNGIPGRSAALTVQPAAPSLLTYTDASGTRAVVQNQDVTLNSASSCAAPGTYLTAYLIGTGPLDNAIATGSVAPRSPLSRETLATTFTLGDSAPAVAYFAGMSPGYIGLMQVNLQVPAGVIGDLPLQIQVGDYDSNQGLVCVSK